jgi:hypothetical protein
MSRKSADESDFYGYGMHIGRDNKKKKNFKKLYILLFILYFIFYILIFLIFK